MSISFPCPHCLWKSHTRSSHSETRTIREVLHRCQQDECGHVFVVLAEAVRMLSPSALPHPDVKLIFSKRSVRKSPNQEEKSLKTNARRCAFSSLKAHQAQHLTRDNILCIQRCSEYLEQQVAIDAEQAQDKTLQAFCEHTSCYPPITIDLASTNPFALFIHDAVTKYKYVLSLAALMSLVRLSDSEAVTATRKMWTH